MPISSSQISGMVGGQMAMFANQAKFSQQIGGLVGTAPQGMAGGMQNPFPNEDLGARIAGGMGMALPGAITGLGVAGALAGRNWHVIVGAVGNVNTILLIVAGFLASLLGIVWWKTRHHPHDHPGETTDQ